MRVQALRHKREAISAAVNADARALHVAEQSMLAVVDPDAGPEAAWPKMAPVATPPEATLPEVIQAPAACVDQRLEGEVSETGTKSQHAAFETWPSLAALMGAGHWQVHQNHSQSSH
jgi:hypothetical protein